MKIGITGTRNELTEYQKNEILHFFLMPRILQNRETVELHHGDCVGADFYVASFAEKWGIKTVCHPPEKNELRAFHKSTELRSPKNYLARNRDIVNEVELLMVVPMQMEWQPKGGTWYTHDYAKKKKVPIVMFWPEGLNND